MNDDETFRKINELRKTGKIADAWELGCPIVQENPNWSKTKGSFFWVCYDYLKAVQAQIKERAKENNGNYQPNQGEMDRISFLMDWVIWLDIPTGGFEYRSLLLIFQKNLEFLPRLVLLLFKQRESLFEEEDKKPYQGEKYESPSLMLSFARKVAKAWLEFEEVRQINIDELLLLLDQTREEAEDNQHLIWLDYDEAKCLIKAGKFVAAREFVLPVLKKKQSESWAWGALATTYRKEEPKQAIILFSKALHHAHDEKFALPILRGVAPILAAHGYSREASMCVTRAVKCYESNGWRLKADLENLLKEPWFDSSVNPDELATFLKQQSKDALDILYGPSEQCVTVVQNIHQSGKGFHAYRDHSHSYSVRIGLYKSKKPPKPGEYVRITLSAEDKQVIAAEPCNAEKMADVDSVEGAIRVTDKGFGFVEDTFVPPYLVSDGIDGKIVKIVRIMDFDRSKNKPAWKAIALESAGNESS